MNNFVPGFTCLASSLRRTLVLQNIWRRRTGPFPQWIRNLNISVNF